MSTTTYLDQTNAMMRELDHLRKVNAEQANLIAKLKQQYDDLAEDHADALASFREKIHDAYTARDRAERSEAETNATLGVVAEHILQAIRAKKGDEAAAEPAQLQGPIIREKHKGMDGRPTPPLGSENAEPIAFLSRTNQNALDDAMRSGTRPQQYLR